MKTRVLLAAVAVLVTFVLTFAAHAQGYPLLADADATAAPGIVRVSAIP
ncbi:MAG: hypothetical protein R6X16_02690 [Anaerolineae bacterium]